MRLQGHAIECRLNAEDPERGFAPTPGRLEVCTPPGGPWVRFDSHCEVGSVVPPHYDSMIAKVIAWAPDRTAALARMARALDETRIGGRGMAVLTAFQRELLDDPRFRAGAHDTGLLASRG
ncbi:hypothetical protein Acsp06_10580 [Actinomycetospora sp. NBRC 106375]|uniref:hypothetical protein n=1 Tax=Actinomycetospora sp. NBRC 106375 TaxID=3032207 RepID=UPI0024A128E2|nr:hypothetical protein [Actinomycetospora sp. NBRC 106375]GLZ44873.1 hypothetical protein Acsp06_10580 [Actinomycetospora sp. NBRC 106375]